MMVFLQPRARIARIAAAGSLLLATAIAVPRNGKGYEIAFSDGSRRHPAREACPLSHQLGPPACTHSGRVPRGGPGRAAGG